MLQNEHPGLPRGYGINFSFKIMEASFTFLSKLLSQIPGYDSDGRRRNRLHVYTVFLQVAYTHIRAFKYSYKHIYTQVHFRSLVNVY